MSDEKTELPLLGDAEPDLRDAPEEHLKPLATRFLQALESLERGLVEEGATVLRAILKEEPRLAEPRLELARIHLEKAQLDEAESEGREALRILEAGGQWTMDVPESVMLSLARGLLGEILRQQLESDALIFGNPKRFEETSREAQQHFRAAATLDPDNEHAAYHAFHMGLQGQEE